jgi:hypothetical protein
MGSCCIHVASFEGPGLTGRDLLLLPDPYQSRAMPNLYVFPEEGSTVVLQVGLSQQSSSQLSPAAAAGIAVSAVAAFAMLVVAGLLVVRHVTARTGSSAALTTDKSNGYNQLSTSSGAVDSDKSDRGSRSGSGRRIDQSTVPGSLGSGGSSSQRANANLPLLTPDQLLLISDQTSASQGGLQGGPGFNIVPDWGASSGNAGLIIEPSYEPVYGMFEALHGRVGDESKLQRSTRGQRLTTAISDQVRSIHHTRLTSSMQAASDGHSNRSRRGSSRTPGCAGSGGGSVSFGAASSSAGGDAAAGDAGSAAGEEGDVDDGSADLVLHEVIGQGGFGVVYRCGCGGYKCCCCCTYTCMPVFALARR